ncbi:DnaJ domain-containing protein [Zopfochytrium polystomum]|nr:DnaJ domain-containing protein [Zopfochytrium polystomum]
MFLRPSTGSAASAAAASSFSFSSSAATATPRRLTLTLQRRLASASPPVPVDALAPRGLPCRRAPLCWRSIIPAVLCGRGGPRLINSHRSYNSRPSLPTWTLSKSPYEILNVPKNATASQIKANYYDLSFKFHPDRNAANGNATAGDAKPSHAAFIEIQGAYDLLMDPVARRIFDAGGSSAGGRMWTAPPSDGERERWRERYPQFDDDVGFARDLKGIEMLLPWFYMLCALIAAAYFMSRQMRLRRAKQEELAWQDWALARSMEGVDQSCYGRDTFDKLRREGGYISIGPPSATIVRRTEGSSAGGGGGGGGGGSASG